MLYNLLQEHTLVFLDFVIKKKNPGMSLNFVQNY